MALLVNLRHLEKDSVRLEGQLQPDELEVEDLDELIHVNQPLNYDLDVQKLDQSLLVQGRLVLTLDCECARCLKPFEQRLELAHWACHVPLEGEEKASVTNDCVDLTPYVREDILLEFPQHPLCKPECGGLPRSAPGRKKGTGGTGQTKENSSAWAELNKLKLK
jgi:uncharacterized metal-binding protein YceD (DUF177 family)